jgi:proteasome lid subunit RPN8/RPN11
MAIHHRSVGAGDADGDGEERTLVVIPPTRDISLEPAVYTSLKGALVRSSGREICGFFLSSAASAPVLVIRRMLQVRNASAEPRCFVISDAEAKMAHFVASRLRLSVAAVFHSHPSGCLGLSRADERSLEHSDLPWVVVVLDRTADPNILRIMLYEPKRSGGETSEGGG